MGGTGTMKKNEPTSTGFEPMRANPTDTTN